MNKKTFVVAALAALFAGSPAVPAVANEATVVYHNVCNPWKWKIATGAFEAETGYKINWRRGDTGEAVIADMKAGKVQIALMGSSTFAAGAATGLDAQLFWIAEDIRDAEALVARANSGILAPQDLRGKTIAAPFYTTTHYHLLFALQQFGIGADEVNIKNMQAPDIARAFAAGQIDAGFVWDPALAQMKKSGNVLIASGQLSDWGRPTFDGLVVDRAWGQQNREFMKKFTQALAAADADYRNNTAAWTADSQRVAALVKLAGCDAEAAVDTLALYGFPTPQMQGSARWLGGKNSGAARALRHAAQFLQAQKQLQTVPANFDRFVTDAYLP